MVTLYDASTGNEIGTISASQLQFLVDELEEESSTDQDYYLNRATLDMFERDGVDPELVSLLRTAMGDRIDMDIRWSQK